MPTMSLLTDLSSLPPKRQFDHSGCQYWGFPPNFKRPKFDAIRDFPKHFGATGNSKIGEEWVVSVEPSEISVTSDMKSESTEPMVSSHDNVEELPTMNLLPDERPLSKLPGKILFDLGGCQRRGFPPNFKRPKVDAIRDSPRHCCVLTHQITEKPSECISVVATTGDSKVGEEGAVVPVKPSGISKPSDVKSESTTAAVAGEKVVLKTPDDSKLTNVTENLAEAKSIDTLDILKLLSLPRPLVRKYPPLKIRKGIPVYRTYPPGCRMLNHASKSKILVNKSGVEHRPLVETTTVGKQFEVQILDVHGLERNLEVNAVKEMADKVQAKSTEIIGSESCKQIQSRTSSEFKVKQDNKVETGNVSPSEIILLPPDSMCQTVNTKIKEDNGLVGRMGKELEEYCEDTDVKDGSDMVIWSQAAQHFDLKPLSCDWAIAKQEGEWVCNCEPLEATCGYKIQNHEVYDAGESNYVLLQNQDIAEAYKQDYTKENSLFLSEESANQYEDTPFGDKENHKHIVAKESNVLSIVPFDDIQAIDSQNKVREALDLFDEIFTKILEAQSKEKGNAAKQIHVEAANLLQKAAKVGIDYMKKDGKIFATSIVASGRYANDVGSPDVLKYCGQGGIQRLDNGGDNPFNCNGAIVELKPLVYECGPSCKCSSFCKNRVSQHGIRYQLEVFKTKSRGWGVRSRNYISSGNFICEYVGELLHDKEAEQRGDNDDYLFDIGHGNDDKFPQDEALDDDDFTIDAMHFGNVGRFINHSCSPNLCAQNVLYDHDDKRMPHIMFFATRGIFPLQELTYDYNYKLDQVRDVNGNIKKKNCYCGSLECCGRMY
ncbi:hypothetical protein HYC85_000994 [Camellia sinensis]|uniref:SET domain-containing protein n=1 Tax=Camellia sinensis TaxID=4442 RepID=A0A7J7I4R2_CAMSI|nr:hypothetical protein HYC85_000994 [Camellia sinensis]